MKLSGYEPIFDPKPWSTAVNADNCYDYAIGNFKKYRPFKTTPGNKAHFNANSLKVSNCADMRRRILADNKKRIYFCKNPDTVCRRGYYKIMNFVASNGADFHFYKQVRGVKYKVKTGDTVNSLAKFFQVTPQTIKACGSLTPGRTITFPCNLWAHKRGWGDIPIMVDDKGKTIKDPRKCDRNYKGLNYDKFCGAFCIKAQNRSKVQLKTRRSPRR